MMKLILCLVIVSQFMRIIFLAMVRTTRRIFMLLLSLIADVLPKMQRDGDRGMRQPDNVDRSAMIFFPKVVEQGCSSKKRVCVSDVLGVGTFAERYLWMWLCSTYSCLSFSDMDIDIALKSYFGISLLLKNVQNAWFRRLT